MNPNSNLQFEQEEKFDDDSLRIIQLLSSIPKARIPAATPRYAFAQKVGVLQRTSKFIWGHKLAIVAATFALIISGSYSAIYAAQSSLPGDKLYGIKLFSEQAQLSMTFDQEKVASLHLAFAEKRLDETKKVIAMNDPAQEAVAISALTDQTEKTFNAVSEIATAKAVSQNDSRLLDNLVAINKEQKSVLETASKIDNTKQSATVALSATKATDKSLARIIAAVNEQALLDLPNKISVTGSINSYANNKIVVEKNVFAVNDATVVIDATGEMVVDKFDKIEGKVTVIGTKNNDVVTAKKIIIIDGSTSLASDKTPDKVVDKPPVVDKGVVKGAVTSKSDAKPTTPPVDDTSSTTPQQPSQTQAGFITEPSTQQYMP